MRWRKAQPALVHGSIRFIDVPEGVLAFEREAAGQRLRVVFNLSDAVFEWRDFGAAALLDVPGPAPGVLDGTTLVLPRHGAAFALAG